MLQQGLTSAIHFPLAVGTQGNVGRASDIVYFKDPNLIPRTFKLPSGELDPLEDLQVTFIMGTLASDDEEEMTRIRKKIRALQGFVATFRNFIDEDIVTNI